MRQVTSVQVPALPQSTVGRPAVPQMGTTVPRPLSASELEALQARRSELSTQLGSANGRRKELAREIRSADGASKVGLEMRITQLDQRILGIESDLDAVGQQLSSLPAGLAAGTAPPMPMRGIQLSSGQVTAVSIIFIICVLAPLVTGFSRLLWRRSTLPAQPALPAEAERRMERIEQAVDSIAIEVERISEGQRFVTQLMSRSPALAAVPADVSAPKVSAAERHSPGDARR